MRGEPVVGRRPDQRKEPLHEQEMALQGVAHIAHPELRHVRPSKEGGVHRIERLGRVVDHVGLAGALDHVGGKAVAIGEIDPPHVGKAVVPFGHRGVERRLRLDRDHHAAGGRHGKGRRRIGAWTGTVEHNGFMVVKKALVDQLVEIGIDVSVAEPGVAVARQQ